MKKIIITLMLLPILSFSQECYTVTEVSTQIEMEEISKNRIIFGIKQIMEDVISDKYELCMDGKPVKVVVQSIEAPQTGIELGPWTKVSKKTIVTLLLYIDGKEIEVVGKAKSTVESTLIDLNNDKLSFNKTTFSSAVKKAIERIKF
ncbi:MAG: hypothetical protein GY823_07955 [Flavobacteriaceae bacterium]|nr:hypothetical protein [Flavobacteriaceae bacterium]|tara:strand:- start:7012 stop:7452 length:441 start_codon:yes stop_codon:yes gene_type:complete